MKFDSKNPSHEAAFHDLTSALDEALAEAEESTGVDRSEWLCIASMFMGADLVKIGQDKPESVRVLIEALFDGVAHWREYSARAAN